MTPPPAILRLENVFFRYPGGEPVLRHLSLDFPKGEKTVVLGRNGAGKSTLFSLCNGLFLPESGRVWLDGEPLGTSRKALREARKRIGLLFQNPDSQLVSASVREDVSFGPINLGLSRRDVLHRVETALEEVGMRDSIDRPVHALSFGQKKRVCLAGVLAMEPEVLILDEPTAGLDPAMAEELLGLLERLRERGVTLISATHDLDFAYAWADHVRILDRGELVRSGSVSLLAEMNEELPRLGLSVPWVVQVWESLDGRVISDEMPRSLAELLRAISGCS